MICYHVPLVINELNRGPAFWQTKDNNSLLSTMRQDITITWLIIDNSWKYASN